MHTTRLLLLSAFFLTFNSGVHATPMSSSPATELLQLQTSDITPDQVRFNYAKGIDYLNRGDATQAKAAFEQSLLLDPEHIYSLLGLAEASFKLDDINTATQAIEAAAEIAPDEPRVLVSLARLRTLQGRHKETEKVLLKAVEKAPDLFQAQIDLADMYATVTRNYPDAAKHYQAAVKINPRHAGAYYGLGVSHRNMKNSSAAKQAFMRAAELDPDIPLPEQALGELFLDENNPEQAFSFFEKAKQKDPGYGAPYFSLVDYYMNRNEPAKAQAEVNTLIKHNPDMAEAYVIRGIINDSLHKKSRAKTDYQTAIEKGSNNPLAYNNLAWLLATEEKNFDRAIELVNKAIAIAPNAAGFYDTLGWALHLKGESEQARSRLERANELSPNDPTILYHLGIVFQALGMNQQAMEQLNNALKLNPDKQLAADIQAAMQH